MGTAQPRSVALTGSFSRTNARRRVGHVLVGIASWIALATLWIWQMHTYVPSNWFAAVELIFVLLAGWACFSLVWVAWCRDIYRRRHRRTRPLQQAVDFSADTLGRKIVAPPGIGSARGHVILSVDASDAKHYQLAREPEQSSPPTDSLRTPSDVGREMSAV